MNFVIWILNRLKQYVVNATSGQWEWVHQYRRLILNDKGFSLMVTTFFGLLWMGIAFVCSIIMLDDRKEIFLAMKAAWLAIPAFYCYNWLAALYSIYDRERTETWEALKRNHQEHT